MTYAFLKRELRGYENMIRICNLCILGMKWQKLRPLKLWGKVLTMEFEGNRLRTGEID